MEDETVQFLRQTNRTQLLLHRRKLRDEESDSRRSNFSISSENIKDIVNKLKTKTSISVTELSALKNMLNDDRKTMELVLSVNGALRGLIRELTGNDIAKQCQAAGCICNLALGDSRAGVAVTKSAGPYLIAALDNLTTELAVTCAWTIGNLAGSGPRACDLLVSQGAVSKLAGLLSHSTQDVRDAGLEALVHFVYTVEDLKSDHLDRIVVAVQKLDISEQTSQILFYLSCQEDFTASLLAEEYILKIINIVVEKIEHSLNKENEQFIFLTRTLANMCDKSVYTLILNMLMERNLCCQMKKMLQCEHAEIILWLLGNMFNICGEHLFFTELLR